MQAGTVRFANSAQGHRLIQFGGESKDPFVHICALEQVGNHRLTEGQMASIDAVAIKVAATNVQMAKYDFERLPGLGPRWCARPGA